MESVGTGYGVAALIGATVAVVPVLLRELFDFRRHREITKQKQDELTSIELRWASEAVIGEWIKCAGTAGEALAELSNAVKDCIKHFEISSSNADPAIDKAEDMFVAHNLREKIDKLLAASGRLNNSLFEDEENQFLEVLKAAMLIYVEVNFVGRRESTVESLIRLEERFAQGQKKAQDFLRAFLRPRSLVARCKGQSLIEAKCSSGQIDS